MSVTDREQVFEQPLTAFNDERVEFRGRIRPKYPPPRCSMTLRRRQKRFAPGLVLEIVYRSNMALFSAGISDFGEEVESIKTHWWAHHEISRHIIRLPGPRWFLSSAPLTPTLSLPLTATVHDGVYHPKRLRHPRPHTAIGSRFVDKHGFCLAT